MQAIMHISIHEKLIEWEVQRTYVCKNDELWNGSGDVCSSESMPKNIDLPWVLNAKRKYFTPVSSERKICITWEALELRISTEQNTCCTEVVVTAKLQILMNLVGSQQQKYRALCCQENMLLIITKLKNQFLKT